MTNLKNAKKFHERSCRNAALSILVIYRLLTAFIMVVPPYGLVKCKLLSSPHSCTICQQELVSDNTCYNLWLYKLDTSVSRTHLVNRLFTCVTWIQQLCFRAVAQQNALKLSLFFPCVLHYTLMNVDPILSGVPGRDRKLDFSSGPCREYLLLTGWIFSNRGSNR